MPSMSRIRSSSRSASHPKSSGQLSKLPVGMLHEASAEYAPLAMSRPQPYSGWPGCTGPMRYGRIISLSSCSTMWQCQTNWPAVSNRAFTRVT